MPVGSGSGVVISSTVILVCVVSTSATALLVFTQRHFHMALVAKIEEFIEQVSAIDMSQTVEMGQEAMEIQMQAQKQAQIMEFLKSFIQPKINVTEVRGRDESGKFSA